MTEFSLSIITPDRTELDLRRRGYEQGRTSVTMEILNFPGKNDLPRKSQNYAG